jgi:hypothetical protein
MEAPVASPTAETDTKTETDLVGEPEGVGAPDVAGEPDAAETPYVVGEMDALSRAAQEASRRRTRLVRLVSLLALALAALTTAAIVAGASGGDEKAPVNVFSDLRVAERELTETLVARDGEPETGDAIRAARAMLAEIESIEVGPLPESARRALASRRVLVRAIGSVLNNPRSELADDLPRFRNEAVTAGATAGLSLPDMTLPGQ